MTTTDSKLTVRRFSLLLSSILTLTLTVSAEDWPMFGRDRTRNPVSPEKGAPVEWDVKSGRNIKWKAKLGSMTFSDPVIANGLAWIGSDKQGAAILMCFRESDGKFMYQYVVSTKSGLLYPMTRLRFNGSPLMEGQRLWLTTLAGVVESLDLAPLLAGGPTPKSVWQVDLPEEFGVYPRYPYMADGRTCSIGASYNNRIYVITGNGAGWSLTDVPSPHAPSLICFDKDTGKAIWEDNSPGSKILYGQWGSPLVMEINRRAQVIAPQGDGWVRSFDAMTGELIWKCDINPKSATNRWARNHFMNAPVFHDGLIYIGGGQSLEQGIGPGRLFCIDPTRKWRSKPLPAV